MTEDKKKEDPKPEKKEPVPKLFLNDKQEMFCREYITDFNGTKAAIRAGYSEKSAAEQASELLTKPKIQERVDTLIEERARALTVTQDWVISRLQEVARRCLQEVRPLKGPFGTDVKDDEGNQLFVFDARGGNQALELLGKHLGAFKEGDKTPNVLVVNVTPNFGEKKIITEKLPTAVPPAAPGESPK